MATEFKLVKKDNAGELEKELNTISKEDKLHPWVFLGIAYCGDGLLATLSREASPEIPLSPEQLARKSPDWVDPTIL